MMTNKIAIITGGSRGLGRNTAVNLARRGVDILFTYHSNQKEAESLIREAEALGRKAENSKTTVTVPTASQAVKNNRRRCIVDHLL
jgi:NAD(P)-dependent dehydrogenase (short-subunit alcohol dehydrogenase family)